MIVGVQDVYLYVQDMLWALRFCNWGSVVAFEDPDSNVLKLMPASA